MDIKDNITVIDIKNQNEVIAIISKEEIIIKDGYDVLLDVGLDE